MYYSSCPDPTDCDYHLDQIEAAITSAPKGGALGSAVKGGSGDGRRTQGRVAFICNCEPADIPAILDQMRASRTWPVERTHLFATDRWTPTRSVASDPGRRAFAVSLNTEGVLPSIQTTGNPSFDLLDRRWHEAGQRTSLFASAIATFDAINVAFRAGLLRQSDATATVAQVVAGLNATAATAWGAGGLLALDADGDLYRASYDRYLLTEDQGWVVNGTVDARALPTAAGAPSERAYQDQ